MRSYIDISVIHSYPLSNLNRDDLNSPKTAVYGGSVRGRVSSQATKRPVRLRIEDLLASPAIRTRGIPAAVENELVRRGWREGAATQAAADVIKAADISGLTVESRATSVMLYMPKSGITDLANLIEEHRDLLISAIHDEGPQPGDAVPEKTKGRATKSVKAATNPALKELKPKVRAIISQRNLTIAAFGRMLADSPESAVDGAISVAHVLTTHAAPEQPDFFTAADDLATAENIGSAHMGTAALNSGTYYRYASVNVAELAANLDGNLDLTRDLTAAFLTEFAVTVPPAKKTSTAPHTPPSLVYCAVRTDHPVSLAGAFENPVTASNSSGYIAPSVAALDHHARAVHGFYGTESIVTHAHSGTAQLDAITALGDHVAKLTDLATETAATGVDLLTRDPA